MQSSHVTTKQKTDTGHEVRDDWRDSCFYLAECICGKALWATSQSELDEKWKAHIE